MISAQIHDILVCTDEFDKFIVIMQMKNSLLVNRMQKLNLLIVKMNKKGKK